MNIKDNKKKKTFFISGHRDITKEEFNKLYVPTIINVITSYDAYFVIGDYEGVDIMAQDFLLDDLKYDVSKVKVFHMGEKPMNVNEKVKLTAPNFADDEHRDGSMTLMSDADIAFVREGRETSGTAQNIIRRHRFTNNGEGKIEKFIN